MKSGTNGARRGQYGGIALRGETIAIDGRAGPVAGSGAGVPVPDRDSEVEVLDVQRVLLDELAARFDHVAHQLGEDVVGLGHVVDLHLQQGARRGVERGFPQLFRVHLAQPLVALQRQPLLALGQDRLQQRERAVDQLLAVLADQLRGRAIDLLQQRRVLRQPPRLARAQHGAVEGAVLLDAAHHAGKTQPVVLRRTAAPAALVFERDKIEPRRHRIRHALRIGIDPARHQRAGDRRLFENALRVMRREGLQDAADHPRLLDHALEIGADDLLTIAKPQPRALDALMDQELFEGGLVLQIDLGLAARDFVERRLRDVEIAVLDQLGHLPEEEGQQQGADMGAVDVGIRHDDDLVIAQLADVELVTADPGAKCGDQRADLLRAEHPVETRALDVQDLAAQRQHRLVLALAPLLGRAAGRIPLDQEEFGIGGVLRLAIGKLAGQRGDVHRRLAPGELAGLARRLAGKRRLDDLADDRARLAGMFLEPFAELLVHQVLDRRPDLGGDELVLGLAGEFRIGHLDRQHAGQPLAGVVAGEVDLLLLGDAAVLGVFRQRPGQRAAQAGKMGAAIALRDVVGEGQHGLMVAVVPPQRHFDADAAHLAHHVDRVGDQRALRTVEVFHEFLDAAVVMQLDMQRLGRALVLEQDAHARVQEGKLAQPRLQRLEAVVEVREGALGVVGLGRGHEAHLGALLARRIADLAHMLDAFALLEAGEIDLVVAPDLELEPVGQRVHHRNADAVQTARHLVGVAALVGVVEFAAGVQLGHDDLGRRDAFLVVHVDRDAAAVVAHRDRAVGMDLHRDVIGIARKCLVDAVVDDLIDHVMQARAVVGVADIHARPFAHGLQALENLDGLRAVVGLLRAVFGHARLS
ncbi:hypothetical protein SDC9_31414 [bioreactor metagenome]|uniref:NAD-specific glutamate dehydrogenase n=1 Tax=bioreactor metagenome TaxID=1076179 RepID=A0A644V285_9ZZZZ